MLLRLEEVAGRLGVSYLQARIMVVEGKLASVKVGERGLRVEESELNRYIAAQAEPRAWEEARQ